MITSAAKGTCYAHKFKAPELQRLSVTVEVLRVGVMIVRVISVGVMTVGVLSVGVMTVGVLSVGVMTLSHEDMYMVLLEDMSLVLPGLNSILPSAC